MRPRKDFSLKKKEGGGGWEEEGRGKPCDEEKGNWSAKAGRRGKNLATHGGSLSLG